MEVLKCVAAAVLLVVAISNPICAKDNDMNKTEPIILSAPLTHSDWMVHADPPAWGPDGVRTMLVHCKAAGLRRIYWRVFDAGKATYDSKLLERMKGDTSPNPNCLTDRVITDMYGAAAPDLIARVLKLDYKDFDALAAAVKIGHELGLEIHAWLSINEEDHGWGYDSKFSREHPEYRWVRRDGRPYHSQLSYAFPEVRKYKLDLVKEILAYDVDGIFLDWIRTGDIRDDPQNDKGTANYGYEEPTVKAFKAKYGIDPHEIDNGDERWVRFRAEPITEFMRSVRKEVNKRKPKIVLSAMVHHRWGYRGWPEKGGSVDGSLRGILCDVRTWAREGLVDEMVAAGYYTNGGTPELGYEDLKKETEGRIPLWLYCWVPYKSQDFENDYALAKKLGTKQMLFWEADYIDMRPEPERRAIMKAMREASAR